jgi:hypothetical protein
VTSVPAFVARFVRAERFLAIVEDRRDRFEGYQDLLWSLELLLRDILSDAAGSVDIEGRTLGRLVQAVRDVAGLPKPLQHGLDEVVNHRNIFVHAMKSDELYGSTYLDDLECVKLVALWYLRDFQKGPRLSSAEAARLLAGGWAAGKALPTSVQVFISYARENEPEARDLHKRLTDRGHRPWMDKYELLPGQEFELEIRRAVERADFFIALMSRSSVILRASPRRPKYARRPTISWTDTKTICLKTTGTDRSAEDAGSGSSPC